MQLINKFSKVSPLVVALGLLACGAPDVDPGAVDNGAELSQGDDKADGVSSVSTYFWARRDLRKCASPMCGGYFVQRVNKLTTKCVDGIYRESCYVAQIDFGALEDGSADLLRGTLGKSPDNGFGLFTATEAYRGAYEHDSSDALPSKAFYRVTDRGLRCIKAPCPQYHRAKLNQSYASNFDGLDLSQSGANDQQQDAAYEALYAGGLYATGLVHNRGGVEGYVFSAERFFLPVPVRTDACAADADCPQIACITAPCPSYACVGGQCVLQPAVKQCHKGGCSGQICSDQAGVVTTCEFRAEYACYASASCEVQSDGTCGWTASPTLAACLASPPNPL